MHYDYLYISYISNLIANTQQIINDHRLSYLLMLLIVISSANFFKRLNEIF